MNLIIFPGGGSPGNDLYASVYRLLSQAASRYGYENVDCSLRWPGHDLDGALTLDGALEPAKRKIAALEEGERQYDIVARSFGCFVACRMALLKPARLRRIVLWGPPPYWLMHEMFVEHFDEWSKKSAEKGLRVSSSLFSELRPIETMLPDLQYETVVATGAQDPYVPQAHLDYLQALTLRRTSGKFSQSITFKKAVPGAVHEVTESAPTPVIDAYFRAIFE
jgi:hypothetical protein